MLPLTLLLACSTSEPEVEVASSEPGSYEDLDGDGYGTDRDCDDTDPTVHPGALEVCDGRRTNCSSLEWDDDKGVVTWWGEDGTVYDYSSAFAVGGTLLIESEGELDICPGTYDIELQFDVFGSVTVRGHDATLSGGGSHPIIVLDGIPDRLNVIEGLRFEGASGGSALWVDGPALVRDSTFVHNRAHQGAAIHATSDTLTVENCTFEDNHAEFGGGAIRVLDQDLTVTDATFINNQAPDFGGAIQVQGGAVELTDLLMVDNGSANGGHVYVGIGSMHAERVTVQGQAFPGDMGGAFRVDGDLTLVDSSITGTEAHVGGAVAGEAVALIRSALVDNRSPASAGSSSVGGTVYATRTLDCEDSQLTNSEGQVGSVAYLHTSDTGTVLTSVGCEWEGTVLPGASVASGTLHLSLNDENTFIEEPTGSDFSCDESGCRP